jgi:uncharacterized protein
MRLLFDVNHPVQVHLLRPVLQHFAARGDECRVVARDKDVTLDLLRRYGIEAETLTTVGRGRFGSVRELLVREWRLLRLARRFRPALIVGTSVHAARVARLCGARSVVINDDDAAAVPLFAWLAYPLATRIVTPACLSHESHGPQRVTYAANQQLFYLHPKRFTPDPAVRAELGLAPHETYGLVRLSALTAHHDRGVRGVSEALVDEVRRGLPPSMRLFISSEKPLSPALAELRLPLAAERMHHVLAAAEFCVGDSQSVTAEAAVLGTPALRLNDFVGRISYLRELERRELAFGFKPGQEAELLACLGSLLADPDRRVLFARRREKLLAEAIDPVPWFVELLESEGRKIA